MAPCWETRGCDDEMMSRCPHNIGRVPCPADCLSTHCNRPQRRLLSALDALDHPEVDRGAAIKEVCLFCGFFLENAPAREQDAAMAPTMAARALNVKIH